MPTVAEMIREALSDEPMGSGALHKRICAAYGKAGPSLSSVQSTLCAKGAKLGRKLKGPGKRVSWVRLDSTIDEKAYFAASAAGAAAKRKAEEPATSGEKGVSKRARLAASQQEAKEAFSRKFDELLAKPFSAFALFAFAQRLTLKRQKPNATVRELVKAVGDRWLLLGDAQQQEYDSMAAEDRRRAENDAAALAQASGGDLAL